MTSSRQQTANRNNARSSTGPKTAAGRVRAKLNARRHGLAARNRLAGALGNEVQALTLQIAGSNPSPAALTAARRIAEAQSPGCEWLQGPSETTSLRFAGS